MPFNFQNPGAAAGDALRDYLIQREQQQRQAWLDGLTQQRADEAAADRKTQTQRQQQQDQRQQVEDQRQLLEQKQHDADRLAGIIGADADLTPDAAETFKRGGYGVTERNTLPARSIDGAPTATPGFSGNTARVVPGMMMASTAYSRRAETNVERQAREQRDVAAAERTLDREARTTNARETREAATERANADRDTRELIARLSQSSNAETRALANELKRIQIDTAQDKLDTTRTAAEHAASAARESSQTALDSVNKLLKDPGMAAATGAYELRGFTQAAQDFNSERDQLVAALTLPNLGALKGPMSDKDVIFVKTLATRLANTKMSESATRTELARVKVFLENKLREGGADTGSMVTLHDPQTGATRTVQRGSAQHRAYVDAGAVEQR